MYLFADESSVGLAVEHLVPQEVAVFCRAAVARFIQLNAHQVHNHLVDTAFLHASQDLRTEPKRPMVNWLPKSSAIFTPTCDTYATLQVARRRLEHNVSVHEVARQDFMKIHCARAAAKPATAKVKPSMKPWVHTKQETARNSAVLRFHNSFVTTLTQQGFRHHWTMYMRADITQAPLRMETDTTQQQQQSRTERKAQKHKPLPQPQQNTTPTRMQPGSGRIIHTPVTSQHPSALSDAGFRQRNCCSQQQLCQLVRLHRPSAVRPATHHQRWHTLRHHFQALDWAGARRRVL